MARRAGLYLRISEDRTGEGLAVDRQRLDGMRIVTARAWTLVGEYVDSDISAAGKRRRPAFDQLLDDVEADRIDTIVALSMDRLTRNRRDQLRLMETCQKHHVLLSLVKGSDVDMTSAVGRGFADMVATFARMEIEQKSERHRAQIDQAARAGKPGGGPRAFGYLKGGLELHPVEAPIVAELYARFLTGAGLGELCDWLTWRKKVTTPRGSRWGASSVRVVLANPRNAGLRGIRPVVNEKTGLRKQFHDIIAPAVWPPIVDEETWRATVAILTDPARGGRNHTSGGNRPQHLLSTIAVCGRCGLHMISSSGAGGVRTYKCSSKMHLIRAAVPLEEYVQHIVMGRLRQPDAVDLLTVASDATELQSMRDEASVVRAKLDGLAADYADGVLDRAQIRTAGQRLRARLGTLDGLLAEAGKVDVLAPVVLAEDEDAAWGVWGGYAVSTRRSAISRLIHLVVRRGRVGRPPAGAGFDPESVVLTWRATGTTP